MRGVGTYGSCDVIEPPVIVGERRHAAVEHLSEDCGATVGRANPVPGWVAHVAELEAVISRAYWPTPGQIGAAAESSDPSEYPDAQMKEYGL